MTRRSITGIAAVEAALDAGDPVQVVLVPKADPAPPEVALAQRAEAAGIAIWRASDGDLFRMNRPASPDAAPGAPARVLAMAGPPPTANSVAELLARPGAVWLLSGAAYPSNVGFAIRTAEVSGATGLIVDAHFTRAQRSRARHVSMGAHRLLPVLYAPTAEVLDAVRATPRHLVAVEDVGAVSPWEADLAGDVVIVLGNERDGLDATVLDAAAACVRIPMAGFVPSYNLQAAMTAIAAERLRQLAHSRP